jgi:excisionase family DNA binding protein
MYPSNATAPRFLTVDELAERFRLSRRTILKLAGRGEIPGTVRLGKLFRFDADLIAALSAAPKA